MSGDAEDVGWPVSLIVCFEEVRYRECITNDLVQWLIH